MCCDCSENGFQLISDKTCSLNKNSYIPLLNGHVIATWDSKVTCCLKPVLLREVVLNGSFYCTSLETTVYMISFLINVANC